MFIIGVGLFMLIIVTTILLGTTLGSFIDLPSFLFVILANIALILATRSIQDDARIKSGHTEWSF